MKKRLSLFLITFCLVAFFSFFYSDRAYAASSRRTGTNENISTYGAAGQGRDYTSLATWEAATDVNLVAITTSYVLECYDDAVSFNDSTNYINGAITNSSYFRIIRPASGQGHDGTPNNGVNFAYTGDYPVAFIDESYFQIQDIIGKITYNSATSRAVFHTGTGGSNMAVIGCIAYDSVNSGSGLAVGFAAQYTALAATPKFIDCLAHNNEYAGFANFATNHDVYFYNCTATNNGRGFVSYNATVGTTYCINCLASGNTSGDFQRTGTGTFTITYSASSDGTSDDFGTTTGDRVNQTFSFVNSDGDDFHLLSTDAGALNYGTDLSASGVYAFDDDINNGTMGAGKAGQTRSGTWDIGFDEAGFTIAGTVYTNEGGSNIGANKTVVLKVNGANACGVACTAETDASGAYSIASVTFIASNAITVFLDGETEKAVNVTRAPNPAADITGLDLYQNRLIVRHEDSGPTTNINLGQYDKDNDADIHFTVNAGSDLTVDNDTEFHVWTGKSFSSGGAGMFITTSPGGSSPGGDVHLDDNSTLTQYEASSIGGSWIVDSGATFTSNSQDVTFTATGTGKTITPGSSSFYSLTFNGSGGGWTFQANATTTDNFTITAGTVTGPSSGHIAVAGNWANNGGTFTPNSSEVKFNATATGKTLSSSGTGNLIFYDLDFNGSGGGWTFSNNATSTRNWKLTSGAFTASSGVHAEVGGQFTNATSGTTTWTDSYLYLNSSSAYTINTKTAGSDTYGTLEIGANTDIRMWDSSASSYNVASSGSLYSMDHAGTSGDLAIYGDYHVPAASTDYWSYANDFDGTASANRQVDVLLANSAKINVDSGTTLQIIGTNTATTTATSTSVTGSYGFVLFNGTLNAQYYKFGRLNGGGLYLGGSSAAITNLANGEFDNSGGGYGTSDTFIFVTGDVITANPAKTFAKCRFDNTNGTANYNVKIPDSTSSYWTFSTSYGAFDGEANDFDPGGDPGYIRWDDSTSGTLSETASSSATFASVTYSFSSQNDTGNLMGAVFISDSRGAAPGWDLNVTSADWSRTGGGSMDYDGDGTSSGQLCLVLSGAAIYAITGSMTGVTKGVDDCFDSGTSQIQIADATVGNGVGTYWLVDQTMSQFIPAMQPAGTYTTTLTITAS